jgi:hypothetical protein
MFRVFMAVTMQNIYILYFAFIFPYIGQYYNWGGHAFYLSVLMATYKTICKILAYLIPFDVIK